MADTQPSRFPLSPAETLVDGVAPGARSPVSSLRKYALLVIFCIAQFLDAFNISALFAALPTLVVDLNITENESVWVISATQLTFSAFLLLSGRISDVYNSKYAFVGGLVGLGIMSIITGFVPNKIGLFILRAIGGIFGSLTIPSALNLIVKLFPEALEQSRAIGVFGGSGAVGNVFGLLIGAIFIQFTSWHWVFWFAAIIAIPSGIFSSLLIPAQQEATSELEPKATQMKGLDIIGVSILTAALILFIFALTTGSSAGWASAMVLAPLIIAVFLMAAFLYYETRIPEDKAAIPPKTWFYPNFAVLFGTALLPYFWWTTVSVVFSSLWQDVYHWSVISTAVHMLPIGITAFPVTFTGSLSRVINPKWLILTGEAMVLVATVLLPFANTEDRYWSFIFPAFAIGSAGAMLIYTHTNIAIFRATPPRMAGTVGAIFNSALQLGAAVGSAAVISIETSIETRLGPGGTNKYLGREAGFWFLFAIVVVEIVAVLVFYKPQRIEHIEENAEPAATKLDIHEEKV